MNITRRIRNIVLLTVIILLLSISGCDDVGIYATIAVSEKIAEGLLPEGIRPSKVLHVDSLINQLNGYI